MELENQQTLLNQPQTQPIQEQQPNEAPVNQPEQSNWEAQKKNWTWKKVLHAILWVILWIVIAWILTVFTLIRWVFKIFNGFEDSVSTSNISVNQESGLYEFGGYASVGNSTKYYLNHVNNNYEMTQDEDGYIVYNMGDSLGLSSNEYEWLDWLYQFDDYIYLDLTFSNWQLTHRRVLDKETKNDLWDPSNIDWIPIIWEDNVKYYSKLEKWSTFELDDDVAIYNDTDKTQTFIVEDQWWDEETKKLDAGHFYLNDSFRSATVKI